MVCDEKSTLSITSNDQLSGWTEKKLLSTSQSQTCTKKGHGHCLVVCCGLIHYSVLNPGKTITSEKYAQQIDEMHQKLQHLQPALVNRKGPIHLHGNNQPHITQLLKVEWIRLWRFASPSIFTWLLANRLPLLQASPRRLQGKPFHNHSRQNAFQVFVESWNMDFYTTWINKHFSLAKMCWL